MYIIIGDSKKHGFKDCLVRVLMTGKSEVAEKMLKEYLETGDDRREYSNIRIKETTPAEEWWNDRFLAN